jgi:protein-tyrosine phosphatase
MPGTDLILPGGGRVRASASYHRAEEDPERAWGLYLCPHWQPTWPSRVVSWENLGLPHDFDDAVEAIHESHAIIREGGLVEVGCQGGIGRTGTVLACYAILDGVEPSEAVAWVRSAYLVRAVETPIQEWWVEWFGAHVLETNPPPRPTR